MLTKNVGKNLMWLSYTFPTVITHSAAAQAWEDNFLHTNQFLMHAYI